MLNRFEPGGELAMEPPDRGPKKLRYKGHLYYLKMGLKTRDNND